MADLSQYVNISFKIDNSGVSPVFTVNDMSAYPVGAAAFQGFIKITQPDTISINPNFSVPDITATSLSSSKPYRLAVDGSLQNGSYTVVYTVKCTGYDDTIVTKTFQLAYARPVLNLTPSIDAFTPVIKVGDSTDFSQVGLIIVSIARLWSGSIYNVGAAKQSVSGTAQTLDFAYNSNYYDALYYASLSDTVSYTLSLYPFASVVDKITNQVQFDVYAPMTVIQFQSAIYNLTTNSTNACGNTNTSDVIKANQLLSNIISLGQQGDTIGLQVYVTELENLLYPGVAKVHSNQAIPSYVFNSSPSVPLTTLPAATVASMQVGGIPAGMDLSNYNIIDAFTKLIASGGYTLANSWSGWNATGDAPINASSLQYAGSFVPNGSFTFDVSANTASTNYIIGATIISERVFKTWQSGGMTGNIDNAKGGSNLFYYIELNGYRFYITNYPTIMGIVILN